MIKIENIVSFQISRIIYGGRVETNLLSNGEIDHLN